MMPRVLVVADNPAHEVVMEEWVEPEHVESPHSASQLIERLSWGVQDAATAEKRFKRMVAPERLRENSRIRSYLEV
jgi:CheY-like chemotaxis protein